MTKQVNIASKFYLFCYHFFNCTCSFELCPLPPQQCRVSSRCLFSVSRCSSGHKTQTQTGSLSDSEEAEKKEETICAGVFLLVYFGRESSLLWILLYFFHLDLMENSTADSIWILGTTAQREGSFFLKMDMLDLCTLNWKYWLKIPA